MEVQTVLLGDIALLGDGAHAKINRQKKGIMYLTSKNIKNKKIDTENIDYISEEDFEKYFSVSKNSIRNIQKNDILISIIGNIGNTYMCKDEKIGISSSVAIIRPNCEKVNPKYLLYVVSSSAFKNKLTNEKGGSVQGYTNLPLIRSMKISLPTVKCQEKIANILSSFDEKIEKNIVNIITLEEIVNFIYINWFCDFNYPGAKGEMHKSENLHIEVPKDWKEMKFGEFLSSYSEKIGDTEAPVYSTTNNGIALRDDKFNKNLSKSQNNNKKIVKDDLIFGLSREILNFGVVTAEIGSVSPVYQIFKIDQKIFLPFMLELEIRINMQNYMDILQLGAREGQGISKDYLLNKYILVPDMKVQKRFEEIYIAIQNKISKLKDENAVLAEIRDTLLPKLMGGELQVEAGKD